jgi:hypothetical protein
MLKKERFKAFVDHFSSHFPEAETELHYTNPFELLVAVVLSIPFFGSISFPASCKNLSFLDTLSNMFAIFSFLTLSDVD